MAEGRDEKGLLELDATLAAEPARGAPVGARGMAAEREAAAASALRAAWSMKQER